MGVEHFLQKQNKFSALQWQQDFGNKIEFSTYAIFLNQQTGTKQININRYLGAQTLIENRQNTQNQKDVNGLAKLHFRYKAGIFNYFDMELSGNIKDANFDSQEKSVVGPTLEKILENQRDKVFHWTNNLAWYRKLNRKNTLRFLQNISIDNNTPFDFWQTNRPVLSQLLALQPASIYKIGQDQRSNSKAWNVELKHYWLINSNHHLYTSIGNHLLFQDFYTHSYQSLDYGSKYDLSSSGFDNDLRLHLNDLFGGLQYKLRFNGFVVKAGLFAHRYSWQFTGDYQKFKFKQALLPEFSFRKKIGLRQKINFEYRLKANIPEVSKYLRYYYLTGFNNITKGNPELRYEQAHHFNLSFSHFSMVNNLNYYLRMQYQYKPKSIKNKIMYAGIDYYASPVLVSFPSQSMSATLYFKKSFKKFYVSIKPHWQVNNYHQSIQNQWKMIQTTTHNYEFKTGTFFKKYPNVDVGLTISLNRHLLEEHNQSYTQNIPFVSLVYDYKSFNFKADYRYVYTKDLLVQRSVYQVASFSLIYQKDNSPWGVELQGQNLFDNRIIKSYQSSEFIISDTDILVQPRIVMLKLRYKL